MLNSVAGGKICIEISARETVPVEYMVATCANALSSEFS